MLSTSVIKNVSDAGHYYAATDNYYTVEEGVQQSEWYGIGSNKLNLKGNIEPDQFTALLRGALPNGEVIGKKVDDKIIHRAGWDLTFSAPKSVSIMAFMAGDKRLIEAHRCAVKTVLSEIERGCSEVRIKNKNIMSYSLTKNMIAALFHHDLSRAEDPQLHTHSVIMNLSQHQDSRWRSMASKLGRYDKESQGEVHGFIERVRNNQRYYGKLYETELAYQVQKLGYEITIDKKTGVFQIDGITTAMLEYFSKRRNKIKMYMDEHSLTGSKAAEYATLHDRNKKNKSDRFALFEKWTEESKQFGFDGYALIKRAEEKLLQQSNEHIAIQQKTISILENVIESIVQFKTTFSIEELVQEASIAMMHQKVNVNEMLHGIDQLIENGRLIQLENDHGKTFLMPQLVLDDENAIISILAQNKQIHFSDDIVTSEDLKRNSINKTEQNVIKEAFSSDQHVLIEGHYTREVISKIVSDVAKEKNLQVAIVSPNLISGHQFSQDLKNEPHTFWEKLKSLFMNSSIAHASTAQFLNHPGTISPDILLIDQAHLLSSREQAKLLEWGENKSTKMFFFTEKNLLLSQKRSVDVNYLSKHGMKTVFLNERQGSIRNDINQGNLKSLIEKFRHNTIEISEKENRFHAMASHFARLTSPNKTYLVAATSNEVSHLNQLVHDQLKETGKLKKVFSVNVLIPHFIAEHRREKVDSYVIGDVVRIKKNASQSDYMKIVGLDKEKNELLVLQNKKTVMRWVPTKNAEIFKEKQQEWGVGERLQAQRAMKYANVIKGESFTVDSRRGNIVKLSRSKGKSIYIDVAKPYQTHFDYNYANTPHRLSHTKADHFIVDLTSKSFTTDQRRFFQVIAQPDKVSLYTDQISHLFETIQKNTGNKLSAQDILQSSTDVKKQLNKFYQILEQAIQRPGDTPFSLSQSAILAVDYAMRHLAERNAGFTHKELMETAMKHAMGQVNQRQLLNVLSAMEKAGLVLRGQGNDGTLWTTQEAVKLEKEIIYFTQKDAGKLLPIVSSDIVEKFCADKSLHVEQIDAIKSIVQSPDRVLVIQGRAGTGKTTMMESLSNVLAAKELIHESGYQVQGIAPTHKAVKELKSRGIPSVTIDQFLLDMRSQKENSNDAHTFNKTILIVDEASMVSNRKMRDILSIVHEYNFRQVIPTGDSPHQLAAIEAGKPHHLIQGLLDDKVIRLEDIRRQKNPILKEAVSAIYQGDVSKTFSILGKAVIEIKNDPNELNMEDIKTAQSHFVQNHTDLSYQRRVKAIACDYVDLLEKKDNVQIITPSHEDRKAVNQEVRNQLESKGYLTGEGCLFSVFVSNDMTTIERSEAKNFKVGQTIRFTRSVSREFKAGDYFTIQAINARLNTLMLNKVGESSKELLWRIPASSQRANNQIEVFKKEDRQLKVGDQVVWVKTNRKENLQATEKATVKSIVNNQITLTRDDKTEFTFNGNDAKYQHWDHAYAITAYGAQGGTYSSVLAFFESYRKNLMNLKTFLVTLTRPQNELRIYTDDKAKLQDQIAANKGDKLSSLEVTGEYPLTTKEQKSISDPPIIHQSKQPTHESKFQYDLQKIKEGLNQNAEKIAIEILGKPKVRGGNYLKFGSNQGSLSITTKGEKAGWWNDFSENNSKGRSMLSFIKTQLNLSKSEAVEYAARWLGVSPNLSQGTLKFSQQPAREIANRASLSESAHQKKMRAKAIKIAQESIPLSDTLAEVYLKSHRGIDTKGMKLSNDICFHKGIYSSINKQKLPALISLVRDSKGEIIAIESVYLDPHSGNKATNISVSKQTFGSKKGGSVITQLDKQSDTAILAEGVVTAISIAKSIPHVTVKSVLGKQLFSSIDPDSLPKKVVFCLDYDGKELRTDKTIREAADRLQAHNKEIYFMVPHLKNINKYDYNDVLKIKGNDAIQADFKKAISYKDFYQDHQQDSFISVNVDPFNKKISPKLTAHIQDNNTIEQAEINQFARQMTQKSHRHNQRIQQAIDKINCPQPVEKTSEMVRETTQLERDI